MQSVAAQPHQHVLTPGRSCRACGTVLNEPVLDLGFQPLSNAYLNDVSLAQMEPHYPLAVYLCDGCALAQIDAVEPPNHIFTAGYAYFSSYSSSWLDHARAYAARMIATRELTAASFVIEVASNDGYLLRWFAEAGIRVLGIEPALACAEAARSIGIESDTAFFGIETATRIVQSHGQADLMAANNVLAHVPDINDFVAGFAIALAPDGLATFEFPHLLSLVEGNAWDTIYHEHFSYLSVSALAPLFRRHALEILDVEELPTHGGSLRLSVTRAGAGSARPSVAEMIERERARGLTTRAGYEAFVLGVRESQYALIEYLIAQRRAGKRVAAYGAAAKGNTLMNSCGIRGDLIEYVVDRNPHKVGCVMPGSHIPIRAVEELERDAVDTVLIFPWNLTAEIVNSMNHLRARGMTFAVPIPRVRELA
jgi:SAM-dependent methyltransferase